MEREGESGGVRVVAQLGSKRKVMLEYIGGLPLHSHKSFDVHSRAKSLFFGIFCIGGDEGRLMLFAVQDFVNNILFIVKGIINVWIIGRVRGAYVVLEV